MNGKIRKIRNSVPGLFTALALVLLASCHYSSNQYLPLSTFSTLRVGQAVPGVVIYNGFNAYGVPVEAGSVYKISITGPTDDVDLLYYGTDSTFSFTQTCEVDNTSIIGVTSEDCIVTAPGTVLYFGVDGTFLTFDSAAYTVDVEAVPVTDLSPGAPIHDGRNKKEAALYAVPTTPGSTYTATLTGLDNDADLYTFARGDLSQQASCLIDNTRFTGTTPEDCTVSAGSATLYFIVDPIFSSSATMSYTSFAAAAPAVAIPSNEGTTGAPVGLTVDLARVGQTGFAGTSYYSVPVTAGLRYTVTITGMTGNANLTVYNGDSTFATPAACSIDNTFFAGTTAEDCTLTAAGSTLYFSASANTQSGGVAYITLVSPGP